MNTLVFIFIVNLLYIAVIFYLIISHKKEREKLLDRIMSNNIQEFKAYSQSAPVKRSENGNYLKDRMTQAVKSQYLNE